MRTELQNLILQQQLDMLGVLPVSHAEDGIEIVCLEDSGLEENNNEQPLFGFGLARNRGNNTRTFTQDFNTVSGGVNELIDWFSDGEDSRWECN